MTPEEMSLRGRLGAFTLHSRYDSKALTAPARKSFDQRFAREVDPSGELERTAPAEFERRVANARKAYFAGLALKSVQVRRERASEKERADAKRKQARDRRAAKRAA